MPLAPLDTAASAPLNRIVRVAVVAVTLALFLGSTLHAVTGQRDLAILFALATPLGISALGFARAGHNEAALVLLCCVLTTVVTMVLVLNPLGVHAVAITAYGGIILVGALLLSRRAFYALALITVAAASLAFVLDITGNTHSVIARHTTWAQLVEFLVIIGVFAMLGRVGAENLFGSVGAARRAETDDPVTLLHNRAGFLDMAGARLAASKSSSACAALILADLDSFMRVNTVIGHRAADAVLLEVAKRIRGVVGDHLCGRIGDDEFAVLAMPLPDEAACERVARDVHRALSFEFSGVSVRTSVGFARSPRDAHGIESLLLAAEGSLIRAKDHAHEANGFAGPADRI